MIFLIFFRQSKVLVRVCFLFKYDSLLYKKCIHAFVKLLLFIVNHLSQGSHFNAALLFVYAAAKETLDQATHIWEDLM